MFYLVFALLGLVSGLPFDNSTLDGLARAFPHLSRQQVIDVAALIQQNIQNSPVPANVSRRELQCTPYGPSPEIPKSVHRLRPGDIQAVGAMGDSLVAGFGMKARTLLDLTTEWRGSSWSIGGQYDLNSETTVPNVLKTYAPILTGYSVGNGKETTANARLNVAVSGAIVHDMPAQAQGFVSKAQATLGSSFGTAWKHLSIFIGCNNLCAYCNDPAKHSAANFRAILAQTLDYLHKNCPLLFVSLHLPIDVTKLYPLGATSATCATLHPNLCPCGTKANPNERETISLLSKEYQQIVRELAAAPEFQSETFAVVAQPFLVDTDIPLLPDGRPDSSYFAPDCFHFSAKAHEAAGVGMWANLVEPVGSKRTNWRLGEPLECPRQNQFLCTIHNSPSGCF